EQLTYGGWPLYTFIADSQAGDTSGQGVNDQWFVVSVDGTPVGAPEAGGSEAADAEEGQDESAGADEMAALMEEGATVFARICAACHGPNGDQALVEHAAILADNSRLENA